MSLQYLYKTHRTLEKIEHLFSGKFKDHYSSFMIVRYDHLQHLRKSKIDFLPILVIPTRHLRFFYTRRSYLKRSYPLIFYRKRSALGYTKEKTLSGKLSNIEYFMLQNVYVPLYTMFAIRSLVHLVDHTHQAKYIYIFTKYSRSKLHVFTKNFHIF